jgi:hypothetical protein
VQLYFGSGCGMMIFYLRAAIQRTIDVSPAFMEYGLSTCKPCTEQAGGLEAFLHGAAQNFEVVLNIQDQKLKIKNI